MEFVQFTVVGNVVLLIGRLHGSVSSFEVVGGGEGERAGVSVGVG